MEHLAEGTAAHAALRQRGIAGLMLPDRPHRLGEHTKLDLVVVEEEMVSGAQLAEADERYGKLFTIVIAAVPIAGFCFLPQETTELLQGLYETFTGGG